jgi:hypothetical protein
MVPVIQKVNLSTSASVNILSECIFGQSELKTPVSYAAVEIKTPASLKG